MLDNKQLTDNIRSEIGRAKRLDGEYSNIVNQGLLLEVLLGKIRAQCIRQSFTLARERRAAEITLENKLKEFEERLKTCNSDSILEEYNEVKRELDNYKTEAAKRAMLFTKSRWLEQGERPTRYFLNLEKKRVKEKTIHVVEREDGELITGDRQILRACKNYYEELHKPISTPVDQARYMEGVGMPRLEEREKELCDGLITGEECYVALKSMGANKAPSVSGFNKEFMLFFWDDIGEIIVRYINASYNEGKFFVTQRRGGVNSHTKDGRPDQAEKQTTNLPSGHCL